MTRNSPPASWLPASDRERCALLLRELKAFDERALRAALDELLALHKPADARISLYMIVSACRRAERRLAKPIAAEISEAESIAADRLRRQWAAPRDEVADDGEPDDPADFMRDVIVPPKMRRQ